MSKTKQYLFDLGYDNGNLLYVLCFNVEYRVMGATNKKLQLVMHYNFKGLGKAIRSRLT